MLAVLGAVALAPPAIAAPPEDACALLMPTQVGAAMDVVMDAGAHLGVSRKSCTWTVSGAGEYVTLQIQQQRAFQDGKQLALMSQGLKLFLNAVRGVGDEAYYLGMGSNVGLVVKQGAVVFKLSVYGPGRLEQKEAIEKTLAQQVIARL